MVGRFEVFCTAISSISHSMQKIERAEMAKYGLKGPHAQCMLALERYPEGITASKLCEICEKDKAAISRAITELTEAKMVTRFDPEGKRYRSCLTLTEKGKNVAEHVNRLVYAAVMKASAGYSPEDRQIFVNVLSMIAGNLQVISRDGLTSAKAKE